MLCKRIEVSGLLICGIVFCAGSFAPAQSQPTLTRKSEGAEMYWSTAPGEAILPVWSGYGLIGVRGNRTSSPTISVSSSGGMEDIQFSIPGAAQLIAWSVAASKDHTIAIGGLAVSGDSQGSGFIGIIPPDRSKKLIVRTVPYTAYAITIAPDGIVWAVGWDKEDGKRVYNVLKRFSPSGTLLSSRHMTVKPFPGDSTDDVSNLSYLHSSGDRVGWLTSAGEYLEFSFEGSEIGRFGAPAYHLEKKNGFVLRTWFYLGLSERNEVVVGSLGTSAGSSLWRLNRDARNWTPVSVSGEQINSRPLGFDGDELIVDYQTSNRGEMVGRFSYSPGN